MLNGLWRGEQPDVADGFSGKRGYFRMAKNMRDVAYCTIGPEPSVPAPDRMAGARLLPLYRFYLKIRQTPVSLSY